MAHTPGPWRAKPDEGEIVLNGSSIYRVRDVPSDRFNPADIRLLAAAPELLEALREAAAIVAHYTPFGGIYARFTDLIERIEGE